MNWPESITIIRHGESAGNVARDKAEAAQSLIIDFPTRDVDIPLSERGENQALAVGQWFAKLGLDERPTIYLSSPYARATETAKIIYDTVGAGQKSVQFIIDERLREREFGRIEGFTRAGIIDRFPEEAAAYEKLGKFYYRPPGGESWCDVILRLRSVVDSLARDYAGQRVLIACHSVVVLCLRYLFEQMSEAQILKIDRETMLANCSLTRYRGHSADGSVEAASKLKLDVFNFVVPLEDSGEDVTRAQDRPKI